MKLARRHKIGRRGRIRRSIHHHMRTAHRLLGLAHGYAKRHGVRLGSAALAVGSLAGVHVLKRRQKKADLARGLAHFRVARESWAARRAGKRLDHLLAPK